MRHRGDKSAGFLVLALCVHSTHHHVAFGTDDYVLRRAGPTEHLHRHIDGVPAGHTLGGTVWAVEPTAGPASTGTARHCVWERAARCRGRHAQRIDAQVRLGAILDMALIQAPPYLNLVARCPAR